MPWTDLNLKLLACGGAAASAAAVDRRLLWPSAALAVAVAIAWHRRPDPKLTIQDRCLICLDRLLDGFAPSAGQISVCMYIASGAMPSAAEGVAAMEKAIEAYPRFSSVAVDAPSLEDAHFRSVAVDAAAHVREHAAADGAELERAINGVVNTSLERSQPLWAMDLLPSRGAEGCVVFRVSHALADGLRLVKLGEAFLSYADGSRAELELLKKLSANKRALPARGALELLADLHEALTLDKLPDEESSCFHSGGTLFSPGPPDAPPRTSLSASVDFDAVKAIRAAGPKGTTINDVVFSAFASAVRRYALEIGSPIKPAQLIRALCAVSLPDKPAFGPHELYNDFVLPSIELPVGPGSRGERLALTKRLMDAAKASTSGWWVSKVLEVCSRLGLDALVGKTQKTVFSKHSFIYSNLPGFERTVHLWGAAHKVERFAVYYPNVVTQAIFMSYDGMLTLSLCTNSTTITQPARLAECFVKEVTEWRNDLKLEYRY